MELEKAFDNVTWSKMFEILRKLELTFRDRKSIYNPYKDQVVFNKSGKPRQTSMFSVATFV